MSQLVHDTNDTKKVFKKLGTCSQTFFYILNREFGSTNEDLEKSSDSLAGGILQKGHQCGMLWGATLAVGIESYRKSQHLNSAISLSIKTTQHLLKSFLKTANSVNCIDITKCHLDSFFGMSKFMIKTMVKGMENSTCFNLAEKWTPEAILATSEGFSQNITTTDNELVTCATEVAKNLGGSKEEICAVSGFSGGLGLSGNGCGALSAAIWLNSSKWNQQKKRKSTFKNSAAKETLKAFMAETEGEMKCDKICGQKFKSIQEHSKFIQEGGCKNILKILSTAY